MYFILFTLIYDDIVSFSSLIHIFFCFIFQFAEIRSRIFITAAMVRSSITLCKSISLWIFKCDSSSWRHMVARHIFYHAWRLQGPADTHALCTTNLSKWHDKLFNEVCCGCCNICVCVTHTLSFMFMCGSWFSFDSRHRQLSWFQITIARLWISFVFVFCVVQCPCYTALAFAVFSLEIRQLMCLINNDYTIF